MTITNTDRQQCAEAVALYFDEADEIKAAHLLYEDFKTVRPDINKFQFYIIVMTARNGHDGKAPDGNLGWSLKLKE